MCVFHMLSHHPIDHVMNHWKQHRMLKQVPWKSCINSCIMNNLIENRQKFGTWYMSFFRPFDSVILRLLLPQLLDEGGGAIRGTASQVIVETIPATGRGWDTTQSWWRDLDSSSRGVWASASSWDAFCCRWPTLRCLGLTSTSSPSVSSCSNWPSAVEPCRPRSSLCLWRTLNLLCSEFVAAVVTYHCSSHGSTCGCKHDVVSSARYVRPRQSPFLSW